MSGAMAPRPALILRSDEQAVILDALRRYEEAEVVSGDIGKARIADYLREHLRRGEAIKGIAEIP